MTTAANTPTRRCGSEGKSSSILEFVVVIILAVLAAIAIPTFFHQRASGKEVGAKMTVVDIANFVEDGIRDGSLTDNGNPVTSAVALTGHLANAEATQLVPAGAVVYVNPDSGAYCESYQEDAGQVYKATAAAPNVIIVGDACTSANG